MKSLKKGSVIIRYIFFFFILSFTYILFFQQYSYASSIYSIDNSINEINDEISYKKQDVDKLKEILNSTVIDTYKNFKFMNIQERKEREKALDIIIKSYNKCNYEYDNLIEVSNNKISDLEQEREYIISLRSDDYKKHYCQYDYYNSYWDGTISTSGCGLVSYTVAINILTGEDYTPVDMIKTRGDWMGMDSYPNDATGTKDGSTHSEWTYNNYNIRVYNVDKNNIEGIKRELDDDSVIIILSRGPFKDGSGGTWSSSGHFVVLYKYDDNKDLFYIQDSASYISNIPYSSDDIIRLLNNSPRSCVYRRS